VSRLFSLPAGRDAHRERHSPAATEQDRVVDLLVDAVVLPDVTFERNLDGGHLRASFLLVKGFGSSQDSPDRPD
jgi:hypothetical protein